MIFHAYYVRNVEKKAAEEGTAKKKHNLICIYVKAVLLVRCLNKNIFICAKCEYNQKLSMKNHSFQSIVLFFLCFFFQLLFSMLLLLV